jgi:cell wall-associated NlpC family hydrolase
VVVAAAALGLGLLPASTAVADRGDDPPVPSQGQVERARSAAQDAANRVAVIQADLALANAELEVSAVEAAQAFEAYNGARWAAEQAADQLDGAVQDARRAERELVDQRDRMAALVAVTYQDGGELSALDAVLGADGPAGVMDQLLAYEGASTSMDAQLQEFAATADLAEVFRSEAEDARREKLRLLAVAEDAKDTAAAAAAAAAALAGSIATRKSELITELAQLQDVSVELAQQRQSALEEIERQRAAEEAARRTAEEAERDHPSGSPSEAPAPPQPETQTQPETQPETQSETQSETHPEPQPATPVEPADEPAAPAPAPVTPPPTVSSPPAPSGRAAAALAFARAQLGEPYVWAAAGPDAWDCSGLTMAAWRAGGVSLPHYSVAQYDVSTPISAGQLRPGDLVFWGSTADPGSIFHVAIYAGDGMIIHAPRTGRPVTLDSMYYWVPPNFFGRV